MTEISRLIDTERYPLHRPAGARCRELVAACRAALESDGLFNLDGFVRPEAVAAAAAELKPAIDTVAFRHARLHNIYFLDSVPGLSDNHPALARHETINNTLCADQMAGSAVMAIYEWLPLADFLAEVTGMAPLHLMADPLARANVMAYRAGEALNWHFDRTDFTTTLLLQAPEGGGAFQYRRDLRSADEPNHEGEARLVSGRDPQVATLPLAAGTLNVFRGRNTSHRVTPVEGPHERIIAVFSYYGRPGVQFSTAERIGFYGRPG